MPFLRPAGLPVLRISETIILAALTSIACAAGLLNALSFPSSWLPAVLLVAFVSFLLLFKGLAQPDENPSLAVWEWGLLAYAALIGALRLIPYAEQYITHRLVAAVTWDDNWHFQELASLVTTRCFPPRLNFRPETYLHFYYLPWIPGAALADIFKFVTGAPCIKLAYGFNVLLLNVASAAILILFLRHVLEPRARLLAIVGILLAGAVPEGLIAIGHWCHGVLALSTHGVLAHSERWQFNLGIENEFSMLTTLFVWVPHHLIAAMSLLLAVVIATEPRTLAPRRSVKAHLAAGLLLGFSTFSSIFVFLGGAFGLSPMIGRLVRQPRLLFAFVLPAAIVSTPLSYIYLNSSSPNAFILGNTFLRWSRNFDSPLAGLAGLATAALFMFVEVGWLSVYSFRYAGRADVRSSLGMLAVTSSVYLISTVFISFSGANNYAMRGAIVPIILLACFWAQTLTEARKPAGSAPKTNRSALWAQIVVAAAMILAATAHLNEFAFYLRSCHRARWFDSETESCKQRIQQINSEPLRRLDMSQLTDCSDEFSMYSIERPFFKPKLLGADRELGGRGSYVFSEPPPPTQ